MVRQLKMGFDWFKVKRVRIIDIIFIICLLLSYITCSIFGFGIKLDFNFDVNIEAGYFAVMSKDGNFYVVDKSQERLLKIKNNKVEWEMTEVVTQKVNQIENVFVDDDDNIYIHGLDWDDGGFLLDNEVILKYGPDGKYIDTIYTLRYDEGEKEDKPRLFNLKFVDGNVEFIKLDDSGFETVRITNNKEVIVRSRHSFDQAITFIQSIVASSNTDKIYMVDKRGKILCADNEGIHTYYNFKDKTVPFDVVVGSDETIYFTDLRSRAVNKISSNKEIEEVFSKQRVFKDVTIDKNQGLILNTSVKSVEVEDDSEQDVICSVFDVGTLYAVRQDGEVICNQKRFHPGNKYFMKQIFKFVAPYVFIFCLILLLIRVLLVLVFNKVKFKLLFLIETIIILTTIVVALVILPIIIPAITDITTSGMESQLLSVTDITSRNIDVQQVSNINKISDFMNDDYKGILKNLKLATFRYSDDSKSMMGGRIEKYTDGVAVAIAYPNVRIGPYYPLDYSEAKEIQKIYETKKSDVYKVESSTGHYLLARSPILNSNGEVVACVCVAKELAVIENTIIGVVEQVVINLLASIIVGIFVINEVIAFIAQRKEYKHNKKDLVDGKTVFPCHILRLSNVVFSMSINMSSVFLPMYILSFYSDQVGIPRVFAATIPLSINVAFILLASTLSLNIFEKFGFRKILIFAICCSLLSNVILATTSSYYIMAIALLINGLGFGLLIESKRSYLAGLNYQERNQIEIFCVSGEGSGKFFGIFMGGFLASMLTYSQVFWMSVITDIIAVVFCIYFCKTYIESKSNISDKKSKMGTLKFLLSKEILSYVVVIPIIWGIILGFAGYYIPVYGALMEFYENETSIALALVSFSVVFFATNITKSAIKKFNQNAIYVAIVVALFAILILICFNQNDMNVGVFVIALLILGIAYSFGTNVGRYKFLTMNRVKEYGENRAQSLYILFVGLGMVSSSMLFGWMLSRDIVSSVWQFALVCVVLITIYKVFFDRKKNNN